jgi:hypothetical protein
MAAPVVNHILPVAIFGRQTLATVKLMVGSGAALTLSIAVSLPVVPVVATILLPALIVAIIAMLLLPAPIVTIVAVVAVVALTGTLLVVITIAIILRTGRSASGQSYRHDSANNWFDVHIRLHLMESIIFVACTRARASHLSRQAC